MKKSLSILALAVTLLVAQACGPKTDENTSAVVIEEPAVEKVAMTVADRKAKLEKDKAERAEQKRIEMEKLAEVSLTYTDKDGNVVYRKSEIEPSFTGGNAAMMEYLRDNLKFPKDALEKEMEGTVFVDFVISQNGNVREVEVTNTVNEEVEQSFRDEAIRVVSAMPKWSPGRQKGNAVDVKFSIPITFEIL
jgi:TonB family protein